MAKRLTALTFCVLGLAGCNWQKQTSSSSSPFLAWMHYQDQFFYRSGQKGLYAPDPMIQKLDLDDQSVVSGFWRDRRLFQKKLDELHIDINSVLVRPDPANVRVLAAEEASPVRLWRFYLLTGAAAYPKKSWAAPLKKTMNAATAR